jgi:hypothetical protein
MAFFLDNERQLSVLLNFKYESLSQYRYYILNLNNKIIINTIGKRYTLVRLSGMKYYEARKIFDEFNKEFNIYNVSNILKLNNEL